MFKLSLKVIYKGGCGATLSNGIDEVQIFASRLSDGLTDLLISILKIFGVENSSKCSWQEEPGNYRWIFLREDNKISVRILWFENAFSCLPDDRGIEIFTVDCDLIQFVRTVIRAYDKLLYENGEEEYKYNWTYDFPKSELERLRAAFRKIK